jgi:hypothetical protein
MLCQYSADRYPFPDLTTSLVLTTKPSHGALTMLVLALCRGRLVLDPLSYSLEAHLNH